MKSKQKGITETMLTTNQVAEALGVTPVRVRQMVAEGIIQAERYGRDLFIPQSQIEIAKSRKTKPGRKPAKKAAGK